MDFTCLKCKLRMRWHDSVADAYKEPCKRCGRHVEVVHAPVAQLVEAAGSSPA